jgi:hypothetical protein
MQNRRAQRAFRARKIQRVVDLENEIRSVQEQYQSLEKDHKELLTDYNRLWRMGEFLLQGGTLPNMTLALIAPEFGKLRREEQRTDRTGQDTTTTRPPSTSVPERDRGLPKSRTAVRDTSTPLSGETKIGEATEASSQSTRSKLDDSFTKRTDGCREQSSEKDGAKGGEEEGTTKIEDCGANRPVPKAKHANDLARPRLQLDMSAVMGEGKLEASDLMKELLWMLYKAVEANGTCGQSKTTAGASTDSRACPPAMDNAGKEIPHLERDMDAMEVG